MEDFPKNIAFAHDWLVTFAGAEKVLEALYELFPSTIHTLILDREKIAHASFANAEIKTSFIERLPFAKKKFRSYLPLFPLAIEQFDLSRYDLILSSSHCVAKGVLTHPGQLHLCYCHTPMRYAWDLSQEYLHQAKLLNGLKGGLARFFLHYLRGWDVSSHGRVDDFIACSKFVAKRIEKIYRRQAVVIYPPVDTEFYCPGGNKEEFFLAASRFVPYKKMDLIAEAFRFFPTKKLLICGEGPEVKKIKKASGCNVEVLGFQTNEELRSLMRKAKAFIFAAEEDFGIVPVEAMACGTPVIALNKGGTKESVVPYRTGVHFSEQTAASIARAVDEFEQKEWDRDICRSHAETFSKLRFQDQMSQFIEKKWRDFQK